MGGSLRLAFGACANAYSPSDVRVVSVDHGCGAHSEAAVLPAPETAPEPILDETGYDEVGVAIPGQAPAGSHREGSVDDSGPGEDLGHS